MQRHHVSGNVGAAAAGSPPEHSRGLGRWLVVNREGLIETWFCFDRKRGGSFSRQVGLSPHHHVLCAWLLALSYVADM